jgi:23S rRNA pseudouridine1911/1915/1917 synthase
LPDERGLRLDRFLAARHTTATRSASSRLIREGHVSVDGRPATKTGLSLTEGMHVIVRLPPPPVVDRSQPPTDLDIVHEDDHLLVVNKPPGMVVHVGHGRPHGSLVDSLLARGTVLSSIGAPDRPGVVHRLDLGTSGLVLFAKTDAAHLALSAAFAERRIQKRYVALVWGHPRDLEGTVELHIGRSRTQRQKMSVHAPRGRPASTRYRVVESLPALALLEVFPRTGRTHQIRVHLQALGHPIVGDARYGGRSWRGVADPLKRRALRDFERLALHASDLALEHPATGEPLRLKAPLPLDIAELLAALRPR